MILAVAVLAASCTLKTADGADAASTSTPIAVASIAAPADIKDIATWTATYNYVISQYVESVARKNAGDLSTLDRNRDLIAMATELDTVAETLRAPLAAADRQDFDAMARGFKDEFAAITIMY